MNIPEVGFNHNKTANREIEVIDLEEIYQRKESLNHTPTLPHRVNFYLLIHIEEGEGEHLIDFVSHSYQSGAFITIQKNQVHAFDFSHKPKGKVLLFTQTFIDQALANMRLPEFSPVHLGDTYQPVFVPTPEVLSSTQQLLAEIVKELRHPESNSLIVMFLFSSLSLMLRRVMPENHHDRLSKDQLGKFSRFVELLEQNFHRTRDATHYADKIHSTYKTLNLICKLATNQTAKQLIDAYTILEAKRRLVLDGLPTQQLAYELGFEDASNFVKYFKKHTLITPSRFQKQFILK
ncbi:AraC family transcriptional regulator [Photobacterium chitinilyticum]|uniref:AraC family transcriptional regulator n=1 Tax=Photobacterium chitinilyticum TaxID=2485123 RepID=A0A444JVJ2_9GAMM|nr:helix-turn-helix transcriptional regulator [Photobacterium chitinilyticum]RWX57104.1 AraC family transcriptional regulator [Photobacterium chitinilyticum]